MIKRTLILAIFSLAACSTYPKTARNTPEDWFQKIRGVSGNETHGCKSVGLVHTQVIAADEVPPIPREEYRQTRRVAFRDFERKVISLGGNAVRITVFREQGSGGTVPFALDGVELSGDALKCP